MKVATFGLSICCLLCLADGHTCQHIADPTEEEESLSQGPTCTLRKGTIMKSSLFYFAVFLVLPSVLGFAAKSKKSGGGRGGGKSKRGGNASTNKGFGKAPPTFEEIIPGLKNRLPQDAEILDCPCGSGKVYEECCQPYHLGKAWPQSPREVLQTRYSAFAYRLPKYIIETTHKECRDWREDKADWVKHLDKQGMFDSYEFVALEPGEEEAGKADNEGYLEFTVHLKAKGSVGSETIEGKETVVSERSRFLYDGEPLCWRYAGGDVRSQAKGLDDVILNQ